MFKSFFLDKRWFLWSILGSALILYVTWYKVELDVEINEWFGSFYNLIQQALATPNSVTFEEYLASCLTFLKIATIYITVAVVLDFFIRHYVFRWRTAMNDYYTSHWSKIRHIEGASQRVQEDTMRFAGIVETLGVAFMRSLMTLVAFLPILWELSKNVTELPWIGPVEHSLVYIAIISALFGTVLLAIVGIKLPGLEFKNQKVEAAYRKELVYGEDYEGRAQPETLKELFANVRKNYFNLYKHYLYFDIAKWSYLQGTVIVPYIALGPTIISGVITLGVLQQIVRAFGKVEESFQFLVNSWKTIVELMSIHKRLKAFEQEIDLAIEAEKSATTD
ncbi:microcin B17 transporter [Enterovibrio norvegicus]|uniref:Peptide antibiotic transporter SbmA n=1 Tax=Enterovibrio norvegicus TaxID=188144 RepID=A0ABV4KWD1_9GAMM|nr:peptide antibiotic transporter SbmA [Enterovibrio norvegicus]MCC4798708.1 peptide antibiotic transporter SbmA [Enterovibrio norvegicus]OEE62027.1 microcin B17 transporter [Enterovibrio norvegicus]OEF56916.1 microcin B17 transporter [Enterovibrio norvegicus]PMI36838.1 microcin B17 transporter [Enterovibrio norvegicus]PMN47456.1 microcin B17 transporter [Enterovibrio norvegicus]